MSSALVTPPATTLTDAELSTLAEQEAIVASNIDGTRKALHALLRIRNARLYRGRYDSFEDYCKEEWNLSASRVRQLAGNVERRENIEGVTTVTETEPTDRAVRELTGLEPDDQRAVYAEAVTRSGGDAPTSTTIRQVRDERETDGADLIIRPPSAFEVEAEYYAQFTRTDLSREETQRREKLLRQMGRTPRKLFESLSAEFGGFTLDAYADKFNALCPRFNSAENPEAYPYEGKPFGNPEFKSSGGASERAALAALSRQATSVLVLPSSFNSEWMHAWGSIATEIRTPRGRLQFEPPPGIEYSTAKGDVVILVYRPGMVNNSRRWNVVPCDRETGRVL